MILAQLNKAGIVSQTCRIVSRNVHHKSPDQRGFGGGVQLANYLRRRPAPLFWWHTLYRGALTHRVPLPRIKLTSDWPNVESPVPPD